MSLADNFIDLRPATASVVAIKEDPPEFHRQARAVAKTLLKYGSEVHIINHLGGRGRRVSVSAMFGRRTYMAIYWPTLAR